MNSAVAGEEEEDSSPEKIAPATSSRRLSLPRNRTRSSMSSSSSSFSFSSSSSLSVSSPFNGSPKTPCIQATGIPFSWEDQPGVPKYRYGNSVSSPRSRHLYVMGKHLPPPPPLPMASPSRFNLDAIFASRRKKTHERRLDPFFVAFVECSKDDGGEGGGGGGEGRWKAPKVACKSWAEKLINLDRLHVSCKTSCAVVQSQVLLPRPYRGSYDLLTNKST